MAPRQLSSACLTQAAAVRGGLRAVLQPRRALYTSTVHAAGRVVLFSVQSAFVSQCGELMWSLVCTVQYVRSRNRGSKLVCSFKRLRCEFLLKAHASSGRTVFVTYILSVTISFIAGLLVLRARYAIVVDVGRFGIMEHRNLNRGSPSSILYSI